MTTDTEHTPSILKSWLIIALLVLLIIFKGGLAIYVIGDLGQPVWDYRPMKDVPGESPYAIYEKLPYPQHIRGAKGE